MTAHATEPRACARCLRRAALLARLSPLIERVATGDRGGRAAELLGLPDEQLAEAVSPGRSGEELAAARRTGPQGLREATRSAGGWACCRHDPLYPSALGGWPQAPAVLFGAGSPRILGALSPDAGVTVVGARRPSAYGKEMARRLGADLAAAGVAVLSGMALGIDSEAHEGALAAGGSTIAVLGCGFDVRYPASKRRLHERIVERGLVLSELPPGEGPRRWTFPARNRIMAALGAMTVVVEARERSGSLITSEIASDLGREVGAVPGRVGSSLALGTNSLLRDGAHVIRDGQDVLDSLLGAGVLSTRTSLPRPAGPELDREASEVLEIVERGETSADAVGRAAGMPAGAAAAALARLELFGYLRSGSAGRYERTRLATPPVA